MRVFCFLFVLTVLSGCGPEEGSERLSLSPPAWAQDFPRIAFGATSADIDFKTDIDADVYYILSSKLLSLTPEQVQYFAEYPNTPAIISSGKIAVQGGVESRKEVTQLNQNEKYYLYSIPRNRSGNVLPRQATDQTFTTFHRQDTSTFNSTAEDRLVHYLIYQPEEALKYPEAKYPVCFFFSDKTGLPISGRTIGLLRDGSLPEYIHHLHDVPMVVVSIQHVAPDWNLSLISEGIQHILGNYPADEKRIYLTGYGEGATACWAYAMANPEKIAAIAPASGKGDAANACGLSDVAVWAFHNDPDEVIATANTRKLIDAINKCSPTKEISSLYFPDPGHNCWKRVYNPGHSDWSKSPGITPFDIYSWMLTKSKE